MKKILTVLVVLFLPTISFAYCFQEAGGQYGIHPKILKSIAKVESGGNRLAVNKNTNGSSDIGLMQINTIWKPTLKWRWDHLGDPCYNVRTGAWILSSCIRTYGYNWKAIGCYNSRTPAKSEIYARKVFAKLKQLEKENDPDLEIAPTTPEEAIDRSIHDIVNEASQNKDNSVKKKLKFVPYVKLTNKEALQPPVPPPGKPKYSMPKY